MWQLFAGFTFLVIVAGCDQATLPESVDSDSRELEVVAGTVQLQVDFSGEAKALSVKVPCSADSTVFSILQRAGKMGDLEFDFQGSGSTVFVHSIDGVMNKGGRGRNWIFRVNDQLATESCGSFRVVPGDRIDWTFGEYRPDSQ